MAHSVIGAPVRRQGNSDASCAVLSMNRLLKIAIARSGLKQQAVAAEIGVTEPHMSKMVSDDPDEQKPVTGRHMDRLPGVVRVQFAIVYAEAQGLFVMEMPTADETTALVARCRAVFGQRGVEP